MTALVSAVFFASLLGSLHCVGMCGAFLGVVMGENAGRGAHLSYHGGRLVTYVVFGGLAGALGHGINVGGAMAGLQPVAIVLSALAIVGMGTITWLRLQGVQMRRFAGPKWINGVASAGYRLAMRRPPVQRAAMVGLLTTLLPCGWLWTFLITAGGTGRVGPAMGVMFVFWLGTLPAMAAVGMSLRGLLGAAQRRLPTLTCLMMIVVGLLTLAGRWRLDPAAWAKPIAATSQPAATQPVARPPCCKDSDEHAH